MIHGLNGFKINYITEYILKFKRLKKVSAPLITFEKLLKDL